MPKIDLTQLTKGEVRMLTGRPRGLSARILFHMDDLDVCEGSVILLAPDSLDAVTPSFVQGFLANSLRRLGATKFRTKFDLSRLPSRIREDINLGMERLLSRPPEIIV